MKEYIFLYRGNNKYLPLKNGYQNSLSSLAFLLFADFRSQDTFFKNHPVSWYNASFIYHEFQTKILYLGHGEWLENDEVEQPPFEEFGEYVKTIPHCKMSLDNYLEFRDTWVAMGKTGMPFALLYRDDNDWIHCKGFDTKEEMEKFVQEHAVE